MLHNLEIQIVYSTLLIQVSNKKLTFHIISINLVKSVNDVTRI